jgi:hypothetical protein
VEGFGTRWSASSRTAVNVSRVYCRGISLEKSPAWEPGACGATSTAAHNALDGGYRLCGPTLI